MPEYLLLYDIGNFSIYLYTGISLILNVSNKLFFKILNESFENLGCFNMKKSPFFKD